MMVPRIEARPRYPKYKLDSRTLLSLARKTCKESERRYCLCHSALLVPLLKVRVTIRLCFTNQNAGGKLPY
jgi:hypothetical protein